MGLIKICGITNPDDARLAADAGADILGFILAPGPRRVEIRQAAWIVSLLPDEVKTALVYLDEEFENVKSDLKECRADFIQLHGHEETEIFRSLNKTIIKTVHVGGEGIPAAAGFKGADYLLFDTFMPGKSGGTGKTFDWQTVRNAGIAQPFFASGGLNPENVGECIRSLMPAGVDVSSGVEKEPGIKDPGKIKRFIAEARKAFGEMNV